MGGLVVIVAPQEVCLYHLLPHPLHPSSAPDLAMLVAHELDLRSSFENPNQWEHDLASQHTIELTDQDFHESHCEEDLKHSSCIVQGKGIHIGV